MRWYWILELEPFEIGISSEILSYASSSSWSELYIYIYNVWPREGESISLAWGRLKSILYSCPNHELSREIIVQKIYDRLSLNDRSMLDTCCTGSFMMKTIEFRWGLLERIKHNSEDWELDEGKDSGIKFKFDCVTNLLSIPKLFRNLALNMDLTLR